MGSKATRHTESSKRGAGLLPLAALIFFLLGVPLALAGQGDDGAESASHGKRHSKASKNQLKEKTSKLRSDIQSLYEAIGALQRQVQAFSGGGPATPSGPAGGALAGTYPDPTLNVSGGPCPNGQELVNVSALAALTCSAGVYSDGDNNVAAGPTSFPALTTGAANSALGVNSLADNTTGNNNSAVGVNSLSSNTTGEGNSALGVNSLGDNTGGARNSALGMAALFSNTTGVGNSALGAAALANNTDGNSNSAVGFFSLRNNTGNDNSALGVDSLTSNVAGSANSALGAGVLFANSTGDANTAVGDGSLRNNTTGNSNTALGFNAGSDLTTGSDNIAIGNIGVAGESNTTRIGSVLQTRAFIEGIRDVMTDEDDAVPVLIDSAGQLGTASSSRRVKRDIQPLRAPEPLMDLRPVSFRYREGPSELHYGLLAEQVARVLPELAVSGPDGLPETVQYQELPVMLLAKVQDQQRQIDRQRRQKDELGAQVRRQQAQIDWLIRQARGR